MAPRLQITYTDELLADNTVHRRYSDGRQEWRERVAEGVSWRDDQGNTGLDEPLGSKLVKRRYGDGSVVYGRENGFGRTLWSHDVLTTNRSSFGGRMGGVLAVVAGAGVLGALTVPPTSLTPADEDELRAEDFDQSSGSDGGSGDYGDWGDTADDGGGDFG